MTKVAPEPPSPDLAEELDRGLAFLDADRIEDAAVCLSQVLELEPENVRANLGMGYVSLGQQDWSGAVSYFARAAEKGSSESTEIGWAQALAAQGRNEQAVWHLDRAAELNGDSADARLKAGELLLDVARTEDPHSARASWALKEAERRFKKATAPADAPASAWLHLGEARQQRDAFRKALDAFEQASSRDPSLAAARVGIAEMANNLERYGQARRAIEPLLAPGAEDANSPLWLIRARLVSATTLFGLREWDRGREVVADLFGLLERESEQVAHLHETVWGAGKVMDSAFLAQLGRLDEAIHPAEEAVADSGVARPYAYQVLGAVHTARGDYKANAEILERVDELYANGPLKNDDVEERVAVTQLRVMVLHAKQQAEEAHDLLRAECAELPNSLDLRIELVRLCARQRQLSTGTTKARWQHRLSRAVEGARRVLSRRTQVPSAELTYGALEIFGDDDDGARKRLRKAVERDPASEEAQALLGTAAARSNRYNEAAQAFSKAVRLAPYMLSYKLALANVHVHLENFLGAETCYREVLKQAPMNVEALVGLGAVLGTRDDADPSVYEEAGQHLSDALKAAETMNADLSSQRASIRLSGTSRAAINYQIGYVRTREFEAQSSSPLSRHRPELLRYAREAFAKALEDDPGMFLAKRAKARVERERRELLAERPRWPLIVAICALLLLLGSAFFLHVPRLKELSGPTYSAMTLGLLVLLMAALYMDRLRSLRVAGVAMEKDVEAATLVAKLGIESNPEIFELLPIDTEPPSLPPPGEPERSSDEGPKGLEGEQGMASAAPAVRDQAATAVRSGVSG